MTRDIEKETIELYKRHYAKKSGARNDLLRNPEVLFQTLAFDRSIIKVLTSINVEPTTAKVLDVGCGNGGGITNFLRLGFLPENLTGIDGV